MARSARNQYLQGTDTQLQSSRTPPSLISYPLGILSSRGGNVREASGAYKTPDFTLIITHTTTHVNDFASQLAERASLLALSALPGHCPLLPHAKDLCGKTRAKSSVNTLGQFFRMIHQIHQNGPNVHSQINSKILLLVNYAEEHSGV